MVNLSLEPIAHPFRYMYNNPSNSLAIAAESTIALMVGYVSVRTGERALSLSKAAACHCSCVGELYGFSEQLLVTTTLCLASVLILRHAFKADKGTTTIPKLMIPAK
jgi:hypothetical protein